MIAQGAKDVLLGDEWFHYDPTHYLISTLGLPAVGRVVEASRERPYLGLRLGLDPSVITSVMVESGVGVHSRGESGGVKGVGVSPLDADLLDATVRLVRLIDRPGEYRALAPLIVREIVYRLLSGPDVRGRSSGGNLDLALGAATSSRCPSAARNAADARAAPGEGER